MGELYDSKSLDSWDNGFALTGNDEAIDVNSELVCVHDSARPLISAVDIRKVPSDGWQNGAAVLGFPVKATIQERLLKMNCRNFIVLTAGGVKEGLEVTDDVSIMEHLKHPVYITEGSCTNIKVTTPDDLLLAERILNIDSE
ncbi:hypothetical protein GIB67_033643 [Kingdonia uniflora]|uniref:2-C-methyl-D-erythritol 4-phosphate cytidylyltransferase n=1 Tax=Kingdonia uniflora TaxID=39325 RepID=A0A7J7LAQ4_9MAGN|nr:hypothetical protein GIB67_033643 [Kingdonia uniflora]